MSHEEDAALYTKGNGRLDKINGRIFCCIRKEWKELEGMNSGIKLFFSQMQYPGYRRDQKACTHSPISASKLHPNTNREVGFEILLDTNMKS